MAPFTPTSPTDARLIAALDAASQGVVDLDVQTGALDVTPQFLARLSLPDGHDVHRWDDWVALVHVEDRAYFTDVLAAVREGRLLEQAHDFRLRRADGSWGIFCAIGRITAVDAAGQGRHVTAIVADVTEARAEQARLRRLASSYATLSELNHATVHAQSEEELLLRLCEAAVVSGGFTMAFVAMINEVSGAVEPQAAYGDEWGYLEGIHVSTSPDTPYGHGPTGTAIRENRPYWCQQFMEDPGTLPWRDRSPDGPPWGSAAALPLRRNGQAVGALTLYMREPGAFDEDTQRLLTMMVNDVNFALDHFAREAAGRRVQREADATRAQLEATIDAMPDLIFEIGLDGRFYNYHAPRVDLLAVPPEAFLGRTMQETMPPAVVGKIEAALDEAHRTGYSSGTSYDLQMPGGTRWFDLSIARKRVTEGEGARFIAVVRDVTTTRAAEAERAHLEAQLRHSQKLEALGQLAGGLAHDINNVLTPILINTPLVREVVEDAGARELLDTTEQCARRGADIIRRLLTFARGAPGERKPVMVGDVCRDMAKIARETFARNITVRVDVPDDLWAVQGDLTQVHQVLMNLCVNARDAMPLGGMLTLEAANVTVEAPPQEGAAPPAPGPFVRIRVRDTGVGMSPAQIEHIFEPFYTTKPIGKGSGLGLPTVLGIVRGHGGFVEVDSAPDLGTTFSIHLPPAMAVPLVAAAEAVAPRRGAGELVLVVDDEATVRSSVRRSLMAQGYTVVVAANGREGVEVFAQRGADVRVVVSDMMMPAMDGLGLLAAIRAQRADVPFILMSGLLDRATPRDGHAPDVVLSKPFEPESLLAAVGRLCARPGSPSAA